MKRILVAVDDSSPAMAAAASAIELASDIDAELHFVAVTEFDHDLAEPRYATSGIWPSGPADVPSAAPQTAVNPLRCYSAWPTSGRPISSSWAAPTYADPASPMSAVRPSTCSNSPPFPSWSSPNLHTGADNARRRPDHRNEIPHRRVEPRPLGSPQCGQE